MLSSSTQYELGSHYDPKMMSLKKVPKQNLNQHLGSVSYKAQPQFLQLLEEKKQCETETSQKQLDQVNEDQCNLSSE